MISNLISALKRKQFFFWSGAIKHNRLRQRLTVVPWPEQANFAGMQIPTVLSNCEIKNRNSPTRISVCTLAIYIFLFLLDFWLVSFRKHWYHQYQCECCLFWKDSFFFHLKHVNKRFAMSHSKSKKNAWPTILPILVPFCLSHTCNQNRLISNNLGEDVPNKKRLLSGNFIGKTSRSHDFQTSIKNTAWSTSNIDKKMWNHKS